MFPPFFLGGGVSICAERNKKNNDLSDLLGSRRTPCQALAEAPVDIAVELLRKVLKTQALCLRLSLLRIPQTFTKKHGACVYVPFWGGCPFKTTTKKGGGPTQSAHTHIGIGLVVWS